MVAAQGIPDRNGYPVDPSRPNSLPISPGPFPCRRRRYLSSTNEQCALSGDRRHDGHVDATSSAAQLVFEFEGAGGLSVRKEFGFMPRTTSSRFRRRRPKETFDATRLAWGPGLGDAGRAHRRRELFHRQLHTTAGGNLSSRRSCERVRADQFAERGSPEGRFRFAGVDDHYFIAAAIDPGQVAWNFSP